MFCSQLAVYLLVAASGQLAFVSGVNQESQAVCVLDLDTNAVTRVGPGRGDGAPAWSPDGQWLAFDSRREGGVGIVLVRHDGSGLRALPNADSQNMLPRWSPDGTRLAYTAGSGAQRRIVVYDIATGVESTWGGTKVGLMRPIWRKADIILAVGLVSLPETLSCDLFEVTPNAAVANRPTPRYSEWAVESDARGKAVAFESNDGGDREIFVLSQKVLPVNVSNHRAADWNPVWSPNGKWLAFESFRTGRRGVYRSYPSTLRIYPVAAEKDSDNWAPAWSPDGERLAFVSNRTGKPELFTVEVKEGELRQATRGLADAFAPAWRPRTVKP